MLGTIRRHQTWLWAIIITVTVVSFVIFGPTNTRMGEALKNRGGQFGMLAGKPITAEQYNNVLREIALEYLLRNEKTPDMSSFQIQQQIYQQLFINAKARELNIHIGTEAVAARIKQLLGSSVSLDTIEEKALKPAGLDLNDLERFFRNKLAIEQLMLTTGVAGKLVTPQEAETMYRLEHRDIQSEMVYFSMSNYLAKVPITPAALGTFYTNQLANYRMPDQVQVSYVKFDVTNYSAGIPKSLTNLDQIVQEQIRGLGTNLFKGAKTEDESKLAVRKEVIRLAALRQARVDATQFAEALDQAKPRSIEGFMKLASASNLVAQTPAPFDREYGPVNTADPASLSIPPAFTKAAFGLTADDPFAGPIPGDDGIYVIALKTHLPSRTPALAEIESKVSTDFRNGSAMKMAQDATIAFNTTLTNGLAAGKTFATICKETGYKPEVLPPFSLDTRTLPESLEGRIDLGLLKQIGFGTPPGKAGPPAGSRDGAFILYVDKLLPIDEAKLKTEMPAFLSYLRQARQTDAFNLWFNAQVHQDPEFLQKIQQLSEEGQKTGARTRS